MATWDDVAEIALALPGVTQPPGARVQWRVRDKNLAWDRPLRPTDLAALGAGAPDGPILGVRVADEGVKYALVADNPDVYFTIPHFDGYAAVLVRLDRISVDELQEVLVEAWLARAPKRMVQEYLRSS